MRGRVLSCFGKYIGGRVFVGLCYHLTVGAVQLG